MTTPDYRQVAQNDALERLPVYLVLDTSWSMKDDGRIEAVRGIVPLIRDTANRDPVLDHKTRFSVIGMNSEARVLSPMAKPSEHPEDMELIPSGLTSYTEAFRILKRSIIEDFTRFKQDNVHTHRSIIMFITDGEPTCNPAERKRAFDDLMAVESWRPNIVMFGVGNKVQLSTLQQYATNSSRAKAPTALVVRDTSSQSAAEIISEILSTFMSTIIATLNSGSTTPAEAGSDPLGDILLGNLQEALADEDDFELQLSQ